MHIEYLALIITGIAIQNLALLFFIFSFFELKYKRKTVCLIFVFLVLIPVNVLYIYSVYYPFSARGAIVAAIFVGFCIFVSKNKIIEVFMIFCIYLLLILIADALGSTTIYLIFGSFTIDEKTMAIGALIHSVYFIPLVILTLKYNKKKDVRQKFSQIRIFLPFIIAQLIFIVIVYFLIQGDSKHVLMYYIVALILVFISMDVLFYINSKQMVKKELLEYKYGQLEAQRNIEYDYIMEQVEQSKKYRKFNHDMRNNLVVLRELLESDENSVGLNMLNDIVNEATLLEGRHFTANPAIDALFNFKQKYAADNGIDFAANLSIPPELPIKDIELCSIFSNLLDNALEACSGITKRDRWINCYAGIDKSTLVVKVENSIEVSADENKKKIKKFVDDSGLGLSIIDDIVKRYNGSMKIEQGSGVYKIFVFIPGITA